MAGRNRVTAAVYSIKRVGEEETAAARRDDDDDDRLEGERGRKEWGAGDIDVLKRACETIIAARCADESAAVTASGPAETVIKPEGMLQQDGSRAKASATNHALCDCDTAATTSTVRFKPPLRVAILYLHSFQTKREGKRTVASVYMPPRTNPSNCEPPMVLWPPSGLISGVPRSHPQCSDAAEPARCLHYLATIPALPNPYPHPTAYAPAPRPIHPLHSRPTGRPIIFISAYHGPPI